MKYVKRFESQILNEAKVKEGDRVKLVYPKYDNDKWAQAFNGQTGEVYSKGDDKNMWYVRLDNPVKIDGVDDPVKTDMWDQSYLKKIK